MYERFVEATVPRPQYELLARAYADYRSQSQPCRRGATNQCAARMSIALGRAGCGLEDFTPRARVHSGNARCQTDGIEHVMGALELANFLRRRLGPPLEHRPIAGGGCADAFARIRGSTGIVYFDNCFRREGSTVQAGDHIDLFDGRRYYNQILHPRAGGDETSGGDLFGRSGQVWFWPLA